MRRLWIFILFLAISCQLSAVSGQQNFSETENLRTSKSESILTKDKRLRSKGNVQKFSDSQVFSFSDSKKSSQVFSFSVSQILYFENQIRLADSLYKNYLPQYNFEEVKAAVMFFDSLRLTTDNSQRTTDLLETENLEISETEKRLKAKDKGLKSESRKDTKSQSDCLYDSATLRPYDPATAYRMSVDCCPLSVDIEYQRARAHYYHAVGLTERDDIVGACEHYFIALEIMEPLVETSPLWRLRAKDKKLRSQGRKVARSQSFGDSMSQSRKAARSQSDYHSDSATLTHCDPETLRPCDLNKEDYEKIRFLALIYTRLGRLFLNENYCDLAIAKYRKALKYVKMIDDIPFKSNVLKELGNSYQLANKPDSALYYYKESLKYNSSLPNKLDVEKSIAQILFYEGKRDSAYMLLKNNLYKINNDNVKYSYHYIIGDLFYHDKKYDSALYYLEESLDYSIINKRIAYTTKLSTIYDSLGDYEKRNYYDNISSILFKDNVNKEVANKRIQVLYNNFKERNNERERNIAKVRVIKLTTAISLSIFVIVTSLLVLIRYKYKRRNDMLSEEINAKAKYINDNEFRYSLMEGKIKSKNAELHQKEEQIKSQQSEIAELRNSIGNKKNNLKEYCRSEICIKIFNRINELSKSGKDTSELKSLSQEEFVLLLQSAKQHLSLFFENISSRYPSLKKEDLYYLCLNIINLNDKQIAALFGVTYQAIRTRRKKICVHLGINMKENLHNFFIQ